jgi:hypothetical protein
MYTQDCIVWYSLRLRFPHVSPVDIVNSVPDIRVKLIGSLYWY